MGKIITAGLTTVKHVRADEVWLITRGGQDVPGMIRRPDLAPSEGLFKRYNRSWKGNPFSEWWQKYVDAFEKEMQELDKLNALRELYRAARAGKTICLVCYCPDDTHCHRRLIREFLQAKGIEVGEVVPPPDPQIYFHL